jgi:hypothetical protein
VDEVLPPVFLLVSSIVPGRQPGRRCHGVRRARNRRWPPVPRRSDGHLQRRGQPARAELFNGGNGLTVNVNPGATLGTLLGVGGTSLSLAGNNTLNNNGTIDPTLLGC